MKRLLFSILLFLFIVGCSTTTIKPYNKVNKISNFVNVEVTEIMYNGIVLEISNNTEDFIEVIWDSSNLNDYPLSFGNNLVSKALEKKPNTSIESKGIFKKEMYIPEGIKMPAKLLIKVKKGNIEEYVSITLEDRGDKTKREYDMWTGEWKTLK